MHRRPCLMPVLVHYTYDQTQSYRETCVSLWLEPSSGHFFTGLKPDGLNVVGRSLQLLKFPLKLFSMATIQCTLPPRLFHAHAPVDSRIVMTIYTMLLLTREERKRSPVAKKHKELPGTLLFASPEKRRRTRTTAKHTYPLLIVLGVVLVTIWRLYNFARTSRVSMARCLSFLTSKYSRIFWREMSTVL